MKLLPTLMFVGSVLMACSTKYAATEAEEGGPLPEAGSAADASVGVDVDGGPVADAGGDVDATDAAAGDGGSTRLKDMTFEDGLVIHPNSGGEGTTGTPMISAVAPIKGAFSLEIPSGSASHVSQSLGRDEFFISFYLKVSGTPADHTILRAHPSTGSSTVLVALKYVNGGLRLASSAQTFPAAVAIQAGVTYRVGLHVNRAGSPRAEAFISSTNGAFGAPFAVSSDPVGVPISGFLIGRMDASGTAAFFDDIKIDTDAMPAPSP